MNKIIVAPASVLVAVLIAGTGLLATKAWNPGWNPFGNGAGLTIENAIIKTLEAESYKTEGKINGEFQKDNGEETLKTITASISFSELIDKKDEKNPRAFFDLDINAGMEGLMIIVKGDVVSSGKDIYFRIKSLPSIPMLNIDAEKIRNEWFKANKETIGAETLNEKSYAEQIKEIVKEKEMFDVKKNYGEEEINGEKTTHYLVEIKGSALKKLIPEIMDKTGEQLSGEEKTQYEKGAETFLNDFSKNFDESWEKIKPLEFECWISNNDLFVKKMKFEKELDYNSAENGDSGKIKISMEMNFSEFGKKFDIEIPEKYKPIEEIFQQLAE